MTRLSSTLLRKLDSNALQELLEEEDGPREIRSRRLTFVAEEMISIVLVMRPSPSIAAVAYKLAPFILRVNYPHGEVCMDWLQASFTYYEDGSFVGA